MGNQNRTSRPRGILSSSDRDFLRGEYEDKSSAARAQRRNAIRERVFAGLLDFHLLLVHLPDDLRREIFREEKVGEGSRVGVQSSVIWALAFLYAGSADSRDADEDPDEMFASSLRTAIGLGEGERGRGVESVNVSIEVERSGDVDDLDAPLEELSQKRLEQLLNMGKIGLDEYTEAIKNQD